MRDRLGDLLDGWFKDVLAKLRGTRDQRRLQRVAGLRGAFRLRLERRALLLR